MFQLKIEHCHQPDVAWLSDTLEESGALSITLTDEFDDPILEPEVGSTPLWPNVVIHALYDQEELAFDVMSLLKSTLTHLNCSIEPLPSQDWEKVCLDQFKAQQFGQRLWIYPSWTTPPDPHAINVQLDPGLAFGTGTHATTSLCLRWLESTQLKEKNLIDYGCGSGILAISALRLGAYHAHAVDIDEQALIATRNNAEINHIHEAQLIIGEPNTLTQPADILMANILLAPLQTLKKTFQSLIKPNGTLVISGILEDQANTLIEEYKDTFNYQEKLTLDGWALLAFKR